MNKILKIAHRGASGYAPENTILAFQKAIDIGTDGIEFDVHVSKDDEVMVIHDETIDRTTNGVGYVHELTLSEIKQFKIDGLHEIPTLNEVLNLVNNKLLVNIELKHIDCVEKVIQQIKYYIAAKNWRVENFIVSSFDWSALQNVRRINKKIQIGVLTDDSIAEAIIFAVSINAYAIHANFRLLTHEAVDAIKENKLKIFAWTANKLEDIQQLKALKVDAIITDFTDRL